VKCSSYLQHNIIFNGSPLIEQYSRASCRWRGYKKKLTLSPRCQTQTHRKNKFTLYDKAHNIKLLYAHAAALKYLIGL